jgi:hypothetical protein
LCKIKHVGVRLSNLTRIKTSSIPVIIVRDCDTSHLKIGLLNVRSLILKAVIVNELITDYSLDVIGLTETWLKLDEFTVLNEASPTGYTSDHIPVHPAKAEVLLTFTIATFNLQKKGGFIF